MSIKKFYLASSCYKMRTKWEILIPLLLTFVLVCGFTVSGAYAANRHKQTEPDDGKDTVALYTNSTEIIGFQQGEQTTMKEVIISIKENEKSLYGNDMPTVIGGETKSYVNYDKRV